MRNETYPEPIPLAPHRDAINPPPPRKPISWKRVAGLFFVFWAFGLFLGGCAHRTPCHVTVQLEAGEACVCTTDLDCQLRCGGEY